MEEVFYQIHGYKTGHQQLQGNINLGRIDQDSVDRLSDISGPLRPGETFDPYFNCYPLPSGNYFVVARTWQDLAGSRAGCVITKSLIIPIFEWEMETDVNKYFERLQKSSQKRDEQIYIGQLSSIPSPPVISSPVNELIEALFLEARQPIIVFNCFEQKSISVRLYNVFWKNLKRNFSICTYALAPRSINNKSFDLLFAPTDAKSKFSDWPSRRIDSLGVNSKNVRHRWTGKLAERIFRSDTPSLFDGENYALFQIERNVDEGTLRLSLLWNELLQKAEKESSPLAILGLLDIINSQPIFADELYRNLQPYILNAIETAPTKLAAADAWKFYSALLAKHKKKLMGRPLIDAIKKSSATTTAKNPLEAIHYLMQFDNLPQQSSPILMAGVGDGLSEYASNNQSIEFLHEIKPEFGLRLLASSKKAAKIGVEEIEFNNNAVWKSFLLDSLLPKLQKQFNNASKNLSLHIRSERTYEILAKILETENKDTFRNIILNVARNTEMKVRKFDELLVWNAKRLDEIDFLKGVAVNYNSSGVTDKLIAILIKNQLPLIKWLLFDSSYENERKTHIIKETLYDLSKDALEFVAHDPKLANTILELLPTMDLNYAGIVAAILPIAQIPVEVAVTKANTLPVSILQKIDSNIITDFLASAFTKIDFDSELLITQVIDKTSQLNEQRFLELATSTAHRREQLNNNLTRLLRAKGKVKSILVRDIEHFSRLLASNLSDPIDEKTADGWLSLLLLAPNLDAQRKVAAAMLEFSYNCKKYDPTRLLRVSYPIVYKTFLRDVPLLLQLLPFMSFFDWDKCKTLRENLVFRYVNSNWSRLGLLSVAYDTGILKDIISILSTIKGGKKVLGQALEEAKSKKISFDNPVIKEILDQKNKSGK